MELRLRQLTEEPPPRSAPPIVRFVHHQVLEMARDCLHKSESKQITSRYFYDMTENLDRLLQEVNILQLFFDCNFSILIFVFDIADS